MMTIQEIHKQIEPALRLIAEMESEVQQQSAIKKLIASVEEQIKFAKSPFYQMGRQIMEDRKNGLDKSLGLEEFIEQAEREIKQEEETTFFK